MATERTQTGKNFLAELARGGFAESLTPHQRRQIHIDTDLDSFLEAALEDGKQVVLTGNPGDGKTQHILMRQDNYPEG
jgi:predicted ATP-dependent serine protease